MLSQGSTCFTVCSEYHWQMEMATKPENSGHNKVPEQGASLYDLLFTEAPNWRIPSERQTLSGAQQRLEILMQQSANKCCADCGSLDPKWVSLNIGVFICIKCSGVHRSLGAHISKVVSVKLDEWTDDEVDGLASLGGNVNVNKKYEAFMPLHVHKPKPDSSIEDRFYFIRRKYELQDFFNATDELSCPFVPALKGNSLTNSPSSVGNQDKKRSDKQVKKQTTRHRSRNSIDNSKASKMSNQHRATKKGNTMTMAGMVEFVGLIKVNVVRGTNLVVRDVVSSDPYVVLALGHQSVKTSVIKRNLNPVWNESLMLSIPEEIPPLKVLVYDKDSFTTDDYMGEAEIDIRPLVTSAVAFEKSSKSSSETTTQPTKWTEASKDDIFDKDGVISIKDGKVRQHIALRLENVERGVLEIELECVPLTQ